MSGYMWGNGRLATREGHYHPIGVDLHKCFSLRYVVLVA